MSKKIIYLLSLLMALSLVFASCKKNGPTSSLENLTPPPTENEDNTDGLVGGDGLASVTDSSELDSTKPLTIYKVFEPNNQDYFRNPVVQVMGKARNIVAVFGEKRYKSQGAVNDVGIDGEHAVDVIYNVSFNAGKRFEGIKVAGGGQASGVDNSRGAPVVFKVSDTQVVIVANSGVGIARTSQAVLNKTVSKLEYIVGTLNEASSDFTWGSWTELQVGGKSILDTIKTIPTTADSSLYYTQMGTHSGKGQVVNKNTLILPVVMAQQGTSAKDGAKEIMGVYFLKGTFNDGQNNVSWDKLGNGKENSTYYRFKANGTTASYYKETIVINATDENNFQYIAIPLGGTKYGLGNDKSGTIDNAANTDITGWFGSPDYLTLQWYGSTNYKIQDYKKNYMSGATTDKHNQSLFIGAQTAAPNGNVTLYKVQKGTLTRNGKGHIFNATSKSGSIDVLGDGTIITVSEDGAARPWDYTTVFRRHSQAYLASLLDN